MEEVSPQPSHINGSSELIMKKSKTSKGHRSLIRKLNKQRKRLRDEWVNHQKTIGFLLNQIEDVEFFESLSEREQRTLYDRLEAETNYLIENRVKLNQLAETLNELEFYLG